MRPVADGVWVDTAPVRFLGLQLTANMTVLRLPLGELVLYSPIPCTPERRAAIEALGRPTHLYAPNTFHHLRIGEWQAAFPSARLHAPKGLRKKRPDLRIDRECPAAPELDGVDELFIAGFYLEETAVLHRASKTLLVADLVHNIGQPTHWWTTAYTKAMGFYDRVAVSRVIRATSFNDKRAARKSVDALLALDFERIVPGHGEPIVTGAREALRETYRWL